MTAKTTLNKKTEKRVKNEKTFNFEVQVFKNEKIDNINVVEEYILRVDQLGIIIRQSVKGERTIDDKFNITLLDPKNGGEKYVMIEQLPKHLRVLVSKAINDKLVWINKIKTNIDINEKRFEAAKSFIDNSIDSKKY